MNGWIKLHRKILDSPVFAEPGMLKLWVYCLLKATHKSREVLLGQSVIKLEPGQFITGRNSLAKDYNSGIKPKNQVSESTLWRWLLLLENAGNLNIKKTNKYSIVTIGKWAFYQELEQEDISKMNSKRTTDEQQMNTNKNVKNEKEKNIIAEIKDLRQQYSSEIQAIIDDYWNAIKKTRKTNQISYSVILKTMNLWKKYDYVVVHYALKKHLDAYDDEEHNEKYTLGIMRNTTPEQAIDLLNKKQTQVQFEPKQNNLTQFDLDPEKLFSISEEGE